MPSSLPGQRGVGRHSTSEAARAVATLCPSAKQEVYGGEGLAGESLLGQWAQIPALQIPFSDLSLSSSPCMSFLQLPFSTGGSTGGS